MNSKMLTVDSAIFKKYEDENKSLKEKVERCEKALCAILTIAYEDNCDEITDIITDSLTGFELNERYEKDALEGKKVIDEIKNDIERSGNRENIGVFKGF
jgi:hypothetical protein